MARVDLSVGHWLRFRFLRRRGSEAGEAGMATIGLALTLDLALALGLGLALDSSSAEATGGLSGDTWAT